MPSKKKKYNARFPPARIKKIMQTDEEVGKVAAAVPVIISRALELFVESLLTKAVQITSAKNAKTLSPAHLKQCILAESRFDFLKDLVMAIPDVQVEGEEAVIPGTPTSSSTPHHPPTFRQVSVEPGSSSSTRGRGTGRPRGRPRKASGAPSTAVKSDQRAWEKRQSDDDESESGDSEDSYDDDEETDTDSHSKGGPVARNGQTAAAAHQKSTQFNAVQPNFYQEISAQNSAPPFQIQINLPAIAAAEDKAKADGDQKWLAPAAVAKPEDDDYDT